MDGLTDRRWERKSYAERCAVRRLELDQAAQLLVDVCGTLGDVRRVFAFGSYARGDIVPTSDLDALIVRDTALPKGERQDDIRLALRPMRVGFDLIVVRSDEYAELLPGNSFGRTILDEAVLLAEFDTTEHNVSHA